MAVGAQLSKDGVTREREMNSLSLVTVIVILATVTMTFGAMIAVFFYRSLAPRFWGHLKISPILWLTTAILVVSSFTFEKARQRLAQNDQIGFHRLIRWTTGLAVAFLVGQAAAGFQILHSGVVLANNPHSWFIFLFSGLHGIHIVAGLIGLAYLLIRTKEPASGPRFQMTTRVVARSVSICWHYLDFLWLLMFTLLLLWKR
ncbi:MAG: cytochrome c oxidase subunit 3 [Acidobacteriaceae bacterium]|nr:cytochrome c oxidase subunit 3 [Acidobacteriaceae bacterium]